MESNGLVCGVSAVLWDFDDTLVDSLPARVDALTRVFRDANIQSVDPKRFLLNLSEKTLEASLAHLAESKGRPRDLFDRYRSLSHEVGERSKPSQ